MQVIHVPSKIRPYTVRFADNWDFFDALASAGDFLCVVDQTVWALYRDEIPFLKNLPESKRLIFQALEDQKTLEGVGLIYDSIIQRASKKNITVIAIGGGILQDVVGFAASTLYRGIRWVYVPTTLLAQSDSCIGGKTSLNYKGYKNLLGTFYPPFEIYIVPSVLNSLTDLDYFSGLGEVVKLHLLKGADMTEWYIAHESAIAKRSPVELKQAIVNSLEIKTEYLAEDEFDQGRRNLLNFGHCYGHALESVSHFAIPHGQAVLIGIVFANIVARHRALQSREFESAINHLVGRHILVSPVAHFAADPILDAMRKDKKRTGAGLALIMMSGRYETTRVNDISEEEFRKVNDELIQSIDGLRATAPEKPLPRR